MKGPKPRYIQWTERDISSNILNMTFARHSRMFKNVVIFCITTFSNNNQTEFKVFKHFKNLFNYSTLTRITQTVSIKQTRLP